MKGRRCSPPCAICMGRTGCSEKMMWEMTKMNDRAKNSADKIN